MRRPQQRNRQKSPLSLLLPQGTHAPDSLRATMAAYLEALAIQNYSQQTRNTRASGLLKFARWCEDRGLMRPAEVTRPILERYQRQLFYARKPNGHPLSARSQHGLLSMLRTYFRWLARNNVVEVNPAADLLMPKMGVRLPRGVLTAADVEKVLAQPDVSTLTGLRDRALMELLWATGMRRAEAAKLSVFDVQHEAGVVFVRAGKGNKDRVVPIGQRALGWVKRYLDDARPRLAVPPDEGVLFLSNLGLRLSLEVVTKDVGNYVRAAEVGTVGSCHLFRHACATQMLEGGADVRFVQELLGHSSLETTQVYTRVAISKLKAVYEATHPAARGTAAPPPAAADAAAASSAELLAELAEGSDELELDEA